MKFRQPRRGIDDWVCQWGIDNWQANLKPFKYVAETFAQKKPKINRLESKMIKIRTNLFPFCSQSWSRDSNVRKTVTIQ